MRTCAVVFSSSSSYFINNRQPNGSLSKVLSKLAVGVRVVGDGETQRKEHEREGDQEETRHRVLACVPSSTARDRRESSIRWGIGGEEEGRHRRLD